MCEGADPEPQCLKERRTSGYLRLLITVALPYFFMSLCLLLVISAVRCHQRRQLRELEERVANIRERGRYVTDFLYSMGAGAENARIDPTGMVSPSSARAGRSPWARPRPPRQAALEEQAAIAAAIAASQADNPLAAVTESSPYGLREHSSGLEEAVIEDAAVDEDTALAVAIAASRETIPHDNARRQQYLHTPPYRSSTPSGSPRQDALAEQVVAFDPASPESTRAGRVPPAAEGSREQAGGKQAGGLLGRWVSRPQGQAALEEGAALATAIAASIATMPEAVATPSPSPPPLPSPSPSLGPLSRARQRRNHAPSSTRPLRPRQDECSGIGCDGDGRDGRGTVHGGSEGGEGEGAGGVDGIQLAQLTVMQEERC